MKEEQPIKIKRPRKKRAKKGSKKLYFTQETEDAIVEYNKTDDMAIRNHIYNEKIKYPFEKLAENILNKSRREIYIPNRLFESNNKKRILKG